MAKKELTNINVRIPKTLRDLIQRYVEADMHTNLSDFTRDALREKIRRDAPEFYRLILQEVKG